MSEPVDAIHNALAAVQDHTRHFRDYTYVYPVISRRSRGLSIGINLNPDKICNFDCVYCEVERRLPGRATKVDLAQVREELAAMIRFAREGRLAKEPRFDELPEVVTREPKDIAFSGDGEPTMVNNFDECVAVVAGVKRAANLPRTKIVLITDAAGLDKQSVKKGLELMDANQGEVWGKLDAGTEEYFKLVNRTSIRFERILKNLLETARARPIVIQSLFLKMHGQAMSEAELLNYCERLNDMVRRGGRILEVHAYTVARPTPEPFATRLEAPALNGLADAIRRQTGMTVNTFD